MHVIPRLTALLPMKAAEVRGQMMLDEGGARIGAGALVHQTREYNQGSWQAMD